MNQNKEYLEKDIKKHKPNLFIPIFNTILGIAFIILMIRVTIYNHVNPLYLVIVIIIVLIFIGGSFFTSFFFKRKNKKLTKDFDKETELLFKAMYEIKKGTYIEPNTKVEFEILDEYQNIPKIEFDKEKRAFIPTNHFDIFINMSTSCSGLMVDYNTLHVISYEGMSPNSIWKKKHLTLPPSKQGSLKLNLHEYNKMKHLTLKILKDTDMYYDPKSGIYLIGELKRTSLDDIIQLGENLFVALYENEVKAIYVILPPKLFKEPKKRKSSLNIKK